MIFPPDSLLWMDIEGYEGHALKGARNLLASGMPLIFEFNPELLTETGGIAALRESISGRRLYDLHASDQKEIALDSLFESFKLRPREWRWTDVLAVQ